jgi:hypothetical protein
MSEWQPIESAPRDGTPFLSVNHDGEIWVTKYIDRDRIAYRMNFRREMRKFDHVKHNGEVLLREDLEYAKANESWTSEWTFWSRLYDFKPTAWTPLPPPPETQGGE